MIEEQEINDENENEDVNEDEDVAEIEENVSGGNIVKNKMVKVIFKHNRTFELYIGKKLITFNPKECKELDASIVEHPDFVKQKNYFMVKEVK